MSNDRYGRNSSVEVTMSAACPNCSHDDQVRSSQTIYAEQSGTSHTTGTTAGMAWVGGLVPVIAGTQSSGSHASLLARRLAPPAPPVRENAMNGGFVALTVIGTVLAFIALSVFVSVHSAHTRAQATAGLLAGSRWPRYPW